jgi:hypothetical protein
VPRARKAAGHGVAALRKRRRDEPAALRKRRRDEPAAPPAAPSRRRVVSAPPPRECNDLDLDRTAAYLL